MAESLSLQDVLQARRRTNRRAGASVLALCVIVVGLFLASVLFGTYVLDISSIVAILTAPEAVSDIDRAIILDLRLPRVLTACGVGAALSVAGVMMQNVFRNPLADPSLIGTSAGAAAGAVLAIVLGATMWPDVPPTILVPAISSLTAIGAVFAVRSVATKRGVTSVSGMLLAGIACTALSWAVVGTATTMATDAQVRTVSFWTLGSMAGVPLQSALTLCSLAILLVAFGIRHAPALAAVATGHTAARMAGVPVQRTITMVIITTGIITGVSVAFVGTITFVGLIVPHLTARLVGRAPQLHVPIAGLAGAATLMAADLLARMVAAPLELPIGVITALAGIPLFVLILARKRTQQ
ncbi:MAG: iron ABC transporter permease [Candidatus Kapabacteria bacterium]|nr:iron ABC transporter permease [Candidatus Kapabacteria bacterium]